MNSKQRFVLLLLLVVSYCQAQKTDAELAGAYVYKHGPSTILILNKDHTFALRNREKTFIYEYEKYDTKGSWKRNGKTVILNPHLKPRNRSIEVVEKVAYSKDSLYFKINYSEQLYENEQLITEKPVSYGLMTVQYGKGKRYYRLMERPYERRCFHAINIKHQIPLDTDQLFRALRPEKPFQTLKIRTFAFDRFIPISIKNPEAIYFEINIIQPKDKEGTPRSREVIIKGRRAYIEVYNGKVSTSIITTPLIKRRKYQEIYASGALDND
ncbi:MAG: hypothetical protein ACFB0B_03350 [Thermonemataceae bacterium]